MRTFTSSISTLAFASACLFAMPAAAQDAPAVATEPAPAAALHHARTMCRRAERAVLSLEDAPARSTVVIYLNRLSDLLFVLARRANHLAGVADVPWQPGKR